jgi:hypothetical protein
MQFHLRGHSDSRGHSVEASDGGEAAAESAPLCTGPAALCLSQCARWPKRVRRIAKVGEQQRRRRRGVAATTQLIFGPSGSQVGT